MTHGFHVCFCLISFNSNNRLPVYFSHLPMESFLPSQIKNQKHVVILLWGGGGEKEISCKLITVLEMLGF